MTGPQYRSMRIKLGLTQAGLAARLGVTRETITRRETGAATITEEAAIALRALVAGI
jgi:DNA-binding XRE family transcriptional regulator